MHGNVDTVIDVRLEAERQRRLTTLTVRAFWGIIVVLGLAAVAILTRPARRLERGAALASA